MSSKRGWTASGLSRHTGMSIPYMSRVMRGLRNPRVETLKKMAKSLGITVEHLDQKLNKIREERKESKNENETE